MKDKVKDGEAIEAIDLKRARRLPNGDYVLAWFKEDVDYYDSKRQVRIWSIGRRLSDGEIHASTTSKFYENPEYECLWLR